MISLDSRVAIGQCGFSTLSGGFQHFPGGLKYTPGGISPLEERGNIEIWRGIERKVLSVEVLKNTEHQREAANMRNPRHTSTLNTFNRDYFLSGGKCRTGRESVEIALVTV